MVVFKYIEDKDVFSKFYTKMFSKRLEKFTYELLIPFFVILSVIWIFFSSGAWPQLPPLKMHLPQKLNNCIEQFNAFYNSKHSGRKLTWVLSQSRGEVVSCGFDKKYLFTTTTAQMAVLLLFNETNEIVVNSLIASVGMDKKTLSQVLISLVKMMLILSTTSLLVVGVVAALFPGRLPDEGDVRHLYPQLHLAIGLDSHSYILPHLLGYLENLEYPKSRIHLELYLNSKEDATADQIMWYVIGKKWKDSVSFLFSSVKVIIGSDNWLEAGLRAARLRKVGRVLLLSGDTLPQQSRLIQQLNSSLIVITPLFNSPLGRKETNVRGIFSAALPLFIALDTMDSSYLTFEADNLSFYEGNGDPLEVFTQSAKRMNIDLWVDYEHSHGLYINETLEREERRRLVRSYFYLFRYALADIIADGFSIPLHSRTVRPWFPEPSLWGVNKIWENVVQLGLDRVIVFEDDIRFSEGGLERILEVLEDLDSSKMEWDLIYLGRKKQANQEELWVPYHRHLSTVGYSYWTLGYLLSSSGAKKLIDGKPLEKIIPVDEYLPIMFDKHPNKEWSSYYAVRNLRAFTLYPLIVSPQRYTNDQDYVININLMGCIWSNVDLVGDGLRMRTIKHLAQGGFSNVKMHRRFSSAQNIVSLLAVIGNSGDSAFYLVLPFYRRGTVADELGKRREVCDYLDQNTILRLFSGLCSAVDYMHRMGYAHRDLKAANILLSDDGRAMLTDFGSATSVPISIDSLNDQQRMRDEAAELCSMPYRAPELFDCYVGTCITTNIDLWSLGCCLYAMCFFVSPFDLIYERGDSIALAVQSPEKIAYPDNIV
uniref:non-specific serine/threonine protein kinase n=1 Tax=Heterorhabditis bacteriophora TaxID=37862 RepID=A0A1I7XT82_HETBA